MGKRSKTLENLISEFNSKSTLKKKKPERKRLSQISRKSKPVKHGVL